MTCEDVLWRVGPGLLHQVAEAPIGSKSSELEACRPSQPIKAAVRPSSNRHGLLFPDPPPHVPPYLEHILHALKSAVDVRGAEGICHISTSPEDPVSRGPSPASHPHEPPLDNSIVGMIR
jgi:hypothetical protein